MHYANAEKSERLSRLLGLLRVAGKLGMTTFGVQLATGSMAPATDISELRAQGHDIRCVYLGMTPNRHKTYSYYYHGKKED